jgi:hypothetical protein
MESTVMGEIAFSSFSSFPNRSFWLPSGGAAGSERLRNGTSEHLNDLLSGR